MMHLSLAQSSRDPFAIPPPAQPVQLVTGDPAPAPLTEPAAALPWVPWLAGAMCLIGLTLLIAAWRRGAREDRPARVWALRLPAFARPRKPARSGPALFAAAADALGVAKPRAKVILELAEASGSDPLGMLLSDHAVSRNMVAGAIAQREKRLYA